MESFDWEVAMSEFTYIECLGCEKVVRCDVVQEENGQGSYTEFPETCPHCGEVMTCNDCDDYREDFCAGT